MLDARYLMPDARRAGGQKRTGGWNDQKGQKVQSSAQSRRGRRAMSTVARLQGHWAARSQIPEDGDHHLPLLRALKAHGRPGGPACSP